MKKKDYTKEQIEALVITNFWKEVDRANKSNDRKENYTSISEPAGEVWIDFDYLPADLKFEDLLYSVNTDF